MTQGPAPSSRSLGRAGLGNSPAAPDGLKAVAELAAGQAAAIAAVEAALEALELKPESPAPGSYLVRLEGQRKLATMTWLIVGAHSLQDRKSTRLNSSHMSISYAVFCLKKKSCV